MGNAAVPAPTAAALAVDGTVKGVVFQDFGSTGFFTTGNAATGVPRNRPISGVTAQAFDADGGRVGTATSGSDGTYTINVSGARSNYLRVQFSGWDSNVYQPGFAAQSAVPANSLGENDTTVQFVELGTADASHVDLSLVIPDQVIQANAPIATAIEYAGRSEQGGHPEHRRRAGGATLVGLRRFRGPGLAVQPGHAGHLRPGRSDLGHLLHPQRQRDAGLAGGEADVRARRIGRHQRAGQHLPGQRCPERGRHPESRDPGPRGVVQRGEPQRGRRGR